MKPTARDNIQGSPYLSDDWCAGTLTINAQKQFKLSQMRFDALLNRVEYLYNDKVYEPTVVFDEFTIKLPSESTETTSRVFRRGLPDVDENTAKTFYEIVYDGKIKLLKKVYVRINEYPEPLSTVQIKRFTKVTVLYLYDSQKMQMAKLEKKDKKNLLAILSEKGELLNQYLITQKLKPNSEENIIKALAYYDTLP